MLQNLIVDITLRNVENKNTSPTNKAVTVDFKLLNLSQAKMSALIIPVDTLSKQILSSVCMQRLAVRGIRFACVQPIINFDRERDVGRISSNACTYYIRIRKLVRARANTSCTYLVRLNQWRIGREIGQCTKIHERAQQSHYVPGTS